MTKQVFSEHLFIFPFSWEAMHVRQELLFSPHQELRRKRFGRLENWKEQMSSLDTAQAYNEYVYFYKPIRSAVYTFKEKPAIVRNYEYMHLTPHASLTLKIKNKTYTLEIAHIDLKLYKTGIGLLCFRLINTRYETQEAIWAINTLSCYVYPPVMPIEKAIERGFPSYVQFELSQDKIFYEDFLEIRDYEQLLINPLIMKILGKPFTCNRNKSNSKHIYIEPILGYQMFCCCLIYNPRLLSNSETPRKAQRKKEEMEALLTDWMQVSYTEVGKNKREADTAEYYFIHADTHIYAMNRRMLLGITDQYPCEKLYDQLVKLVLMQRATLLNLSKEIARVSTLPKSEISAAIANIYEIYVQFINQLYFKEVTEDGEGSLLYQNLSHIFMIEEELNQLNFEVDEVHEYALLVEQSTSNLKVQLLTIIGAALVLPSFVTGFFGMNIFQKEAPRWWAHQAVTLWLNSYVVAPILLVVALCVWSKRRTLRSRLIRVLLCVLLLISISFTIKYGCGL